MPFSGIFWRKTVALQVVLTLPQQRLHYSPRLLPIPPTYKLNGSSFGRPDVDLMFAKWAFNNVPHPPKRRYRGSKTPREIQKTQGIHTVDDN